MTIAPPGSAAGLFRDYALHGFDELFAGPGESRSALHAAPFVARHAWPR